MRAQTVVAVLLCGAARGTLIEGRVEDARTGLPIPAANVYLAEGGAGASSDAAGRFVIELSGALRDSLIATHVGYQARGRALRGGADETLRLEIALMPRALDLGGVTVTASRRAESRQRQRGAVSVAGARELAARPGGSTADALRELPGVLVQKTTAGHGAPIVRGLIGKQVLLAYNGVRLNRPTFRPGGNQYMSTIDADALERIEVAHGPGSVLYGSDAIGGVVNMISSPPPFSAAPRIEPRLRLRYTSADQGRSAHAGIDLSGPRAASRIGATLRRSGDLDPGGRVPTQVPTGYREFGVHAISALRPAPGRLLRADLLALRQSEVPRYDQYSSGEFERYVYDPQERYLAMAQYDHWGAADWLDQLQCNVSVQLEREGRELRRTDSDLLQVDDDRIATAGLLLQATSRPRQSLALRWGIEHYSDRLASRRSESPSTNAAPRLPGGTDPSAALAKSRNSPAIPSASPPCSWARRAPAAADLHSWMGTSEVQNDVSSEVRPAYPDGSRSDAGGAFVTTDLDTGGAGELSLGLRNSWIFLDAPLEQPFGRYRAHFAPWTGSAALRRGIGGGWDLLASLAWGFRAPNFNDTVALKATNSGVDAPSPGLRPETSVNVEIGLRRTAEGGGLEAFLYRTDLHDLIVERPGSYLGLPFWDSDGDGEPDPGEPPIEVKTNAGRARIVGGELAAAWSLSGSWRLRGNLSYSHGQNLTDAEPMRRIPPLMGLCGIAWSREGRAVELFVRAAAAQRRLSSGDRADSRIDPGGTDAWSDWNLRFRERLAGIDLTLTFANLWDRAYKEHGSGVFSPGRQVVWVCEVGGR